MDSTREKKTVKELRKIFEERSEPQQRTGQPRNRTDQSKDDAAQKPFEEPAQLIFTDEETGIFRCKEETLQLLSEINMPLNVVAITGLYRTGKSYLLNRLLDEKGGKCEWFKTGNTTASCTKGIWVFCRPHPRQRDQVLVLLDVEGFGDIDKVRRKEDGELFTLSAVLSNTLVYNNKGVLDAYALDRLNFLEMIDSITQSSPDEEDKRLFDLDFFFPSFVVTLRDFNLELENKDGKPITTDEYLEETLEQKKGSGENVQKYNKIRLLVRKYFKKRKCFSFPYPCGESQPLEKLADHEIDLGFRTSVQKFSNYVLGRTPMQFKSGMGVNGRMFATLAKYYVDAIGQGKQPSILEAAHCMAEAENNATVSAAGDIYKKEMKQCITKMGDHVPGHETLVQNHGLCLSKALEYFKERIIFDDKEIFQKKIMDVCKGLLDRFNRMCDESSIKACQDALKSLNKLVEEKMKAGSYNCETGYEDYLQDVNWIIKEYSGLAGLGPKSGEILQRYIEVKEDEGRRVYKMTRTGKADRGRQPLCAELALLEVGNLSDSIRPETFNSSLAAKIAKIEDDVSKRMEKQHAKEEEIIQANYLEYLQLKLGELERQMREGQADKNTMKEIEKQMNHFHNIYEIITSAKEQAEVATSDAGMEAGHVTKKDGLGSRPAAIGASQENLYEEKGEASSKSKRKKRCKLQ